MAQLFQRSIHSDLLRWKLSPNRKPLVLRGARQVGKTTAIKSFSTTFDTFIYLNLERQEDHRLFENELPVTDLLQRIFLEKRKKRQGQTLLFIDEIQNSPKAVELMRFFHEEEPELYVISAGSLLEVMLDTHKISFPVGRVEYRYLFPMSFTEFLNATGETEALQAFNQIPVPKWASNRLFELFYRYTLIGGMPEIVSRYIDNPDLPSLSPVYQSLITAYQDDVSKYAKSTNSISIIRHLIEAAPYEAGKRITFERFGNSPYRSREVGDALRTLERAMLLYLRYPSLQWEPPLTPDLRKKPRLQFLDTGLLNYCAGLQEQFFAHKDLHSFYNGLLAEHIVAQELMTTHTISIKKPPFWVREQRQSNAEVDFIVPFLEKVIPIEVKSGKSGALRSLHSFIDRSHCQVAIRLYAGEFNIGKINTPQGHPFHLINLPYFLTVRIQEYLDAFFSGKLQLT